MILRIVLWNLAESEATLDEVRAHLREEEADAAEETPGLRLKAWVSDETTGRFGALELWESREAADLQPPSALHDLIGRRPNAGEELDVEGIVEGRFAIEELSRRGLAFEE